MGVMVRLMLVGMPLLVVLSGCASDERLPPVFGAVFGVSGAEVRPFTVGHIPDPAVAPTDQLVGTAANNPGQCIWQRPSKVRFRASCPPAR